MKILYGLPSEGMGHATRSRVIITHLLKNHDVRIVTSDRAYSFMNERFPGRVDQIRGFHITYRDGRVSKRGTVSSILKGAPRDIAENFRKYQELHLAFRPDLVISDFESFTFVFAKLNRIPLVSIDNMQVIDRCRLDIPIAKEEKGSYRIAKNIIRAKVPGALHYLITSFFDAPCVKKNTTIVPPILRDEIIAAKPSDGRHLLVYQTSSSQKNIIGALHAVSRERFFVYGFNRNETHDNVVLKTFSEKGFIDDLASAKGVITNGGFSLISEAVYLHRPILSVPIAGQFEQYVNAACIEKCGYGRHFSDFSPDGIKSFLYDREEYSDNLSCYSQNGNHDTFHAIDHVIDQVAGL
jgi:uncharacterized protein (TIGR00661 family)